MVLNGSFMLWEMDSMVDLFDLCEKFGIEVN